MSFKNIIRVLGNTTIVVFMGTMNTKRKFEELEFEILKVIGECGTATV